MANALIVSGGSLAGLGTFVVGAPFSMRWQSFVNGYVPVPWTPLPSFFCRPVKYASAVEIICWRDGRCAGGMDLNQRSSGLPAWSIPGMLLGPAPPERKYTDSI